MIAHIVLGRPGMRQYSSADVVNSDQTGIADGGMISSSWELERAHLFSREVPLPLRRGDDGHEQ
jgi:hypothetical protein